MAWFDRLEIEHDNLRSVLRWAMEQEKVEVGLRLVGPLYWFWTRRGYLSEGREWLEQMLWRTEKSEHTAARAQALFGAGALTWNLGDYAVARSRLEESLVIWRELGDERGIAYALAFLSMVAASQGDALSSRIFREKSARIWRELDDKRGFAFSVCYLGWAALTQGDYTAAHPLFEESAVVARAHELRNEMRMGRSRQQSKQQSFKA